MNISSDNNLDSAQLSKLSEDIKFWGKELGFQQVGISDIDLSKAEEILLDWLKKGFHGDMDWMEKHGTKRSRPEELVPGTLRVISVRLDYLPEPLETCTALLEQPSKAYISRLH